MAQSGLETLYQHLGPATASMVAGNREYDANHSQDLLDQFKSQEIAKQQADAEQAVKMNPMLLEQQQFKNTGMGLENIGQGIKNTTGTLANQLSQATQPGVIEGTNAENKGKVGKEQIEQMTRGSEMAGQFATQLEQVPILARPQVIQEYMAKYNIDPNGPIGSMITKVPPADLPGVLKNMQTKLHQSSAAYQQAMDVQKEHTASAKYTADSHAASSKYNADSVASASRYGADQRVAVAEAKEEAKVANAKVQLKDLEGKLMLIPASERTPEQNAMLEEVTSRLDRRSAAAMGLDYSSISDKFKNNAEAAKVKDKTRTTKSGNTFTIVPN